MGTVRIRAIAAIAGITLASTTAATTSSAPAAARPATPARGRTGAPVARQRTTPNDRCCVPVTTSRNARNSSGT